MKGLSRKILVRDIGIQNFAVNLIVLMEASINRGVRVFLLVITFVTFSKAKKVSKMLFFNIIHYQTELDLAVLVVF